MILQQNGTMEVRCYLSLILYCDNFWHRCGMVQVEGNNANAADAIMLDKDGYVSETNATNIVRLYF